MAEAKVELKAGTSHCYAVTNTIDFQLFAEAGANTDNHVIYKGAHQTVLGTNLWLVISPSDGNSSIFDFYCNTLELWLCQSAFGACNSNKLWVDSDCHTGWYCDW